MSIFSLQKATVVRIVIRGSILPHEYPVSSFSSRAAASIVGSPGLRPPAESPV